MLESTPSQPWQPLTFGGVARFAKGRLGRLMVVILVFDTLSALAVLGLFCWTWNPVIERSLAHLPEHAQIRSSLLEWPDPTPTVLAQNGHLAVVIDLDQSRRPGQLADVQFELDRDHAQIHSLFGFLRIPYPPQGWMIPLDRSELEPWWGAWFPFVVTSLFLAVFFVLAFAWFVLGAIYALPWKLAAWLFHRQLTFGECWKAAIAAQMPGAAWMNVSILLYSTGRINLAYFLFAFSFHWVLAWIYLAVGFFFLPAPPPKNNLPPDEFNPFADPQSSPGLADPSNPFAPRNHMSDRSE